MHYRAEYGTPRPDVAEQLGYPDDIGFLAQIPTSAIVPGPHVIELVASVEGDDVIVRTPVVVNLVVGEALPWRVVLDEMTAAYIDDVVRFQPGPPRDLGAPLRLARGDRLFVRGWALDESAQAPAAGVLLMVDGTIEVSALYGLPRPDVAAARSDDTFLKTGFTAEIRTDALAKGMHSVTCRVLARDGRGALATAQRFDFEVSEI